MAEAQSQPVDVHEETSVDDGAKVLVRADKEADVTPTEDAELAELLNSALQDFGKSKELAGQHKSPAQPAAGAGNETGSGAEGSSQDPASAGFAEEFSSELAAQFEEAMKSFLSHDPHMLEQIEKLAEAAGNAGDSDEAQQHFAATLSQTLEELTHNAEGIEQGEEEMARMFGGAEGEAEDLMPTMQEFMQLLLSKDILYPSLKETAAKYPDFLGANESKLDAGQLERYRRQHELMTSICKVFEEESPEDTQEQKSQRFEKLVDLMQQMQELGQPPKEIFGEMVPGLEFDESGMPKLPGVGSQCSVM